MREPGCPAGQGLAVPPVLGAFNPGEQAGPFHVSHSVPVFLPLRLAEPWRFLSGAMPPASASSSRFTGRAAVNKHRSRSRSQPCNNHFK